MGETEASDSVSLESLIERARSAPVSLTEATHGELVSRLDRIVAKYEVPSKDMEVAIAPLAPMLNEGPKATGARTQAVMELWRTDREKPLNVAIDHLAAKRYVLASLLVLMSEFGQRQDWLGWAMAGEVLMKRWQDIESEAAKSYRLMNQMDITLAMKGMAMTPYERLRSEQTPHGDRLRPLAYPFALNALESDGLLAGFLGDGDDGEASDDSAMGNAGGKKYRLTVAIEGEGETNPAAGSHEVTAGTHVAVAATETTGEMAFSHWKIDDKRVEGRLANIDMDGDKAATAVFLPAECYLTISVQGEGDAKPEPGRHPYLKGARVHLWQDETTSGYVFSHWIIDGNRADNLTSSIVMDSDKEATAVFAPVDWRLTVDVVGNGSPTPAPGVSGYVDGEQAFLDAFESDKEYLFDHWMIDGARHDASSVTLTMDSDKHATAHFKPGEVYLTISTEGDGLTMPEPGRYAKRGGDSVALHAVSHDRWIFDHWMICGERVEEDSYTVTLAESCSAVAVFTRADWAVTTEGEMWPLPGDRWFRDGETLEIHAIPPVGQVFDHWIVNGIEVQSEPHTLKIDQNYSVAPVYRNDER